VNAEAIWKILVYDILRLEYRIILKGTPDRWTGAEIELVLEPDGTRKEMATDELKS